MAAYLLLLLVSMYTACMGSTCEGSEQWKGAYSGVALLQSETLLSLAQHKEERADSQDRHTELEASLGTHHWLMKPVDGRWKASLVDEVGREHKAPALKADEIDDYLIRLSLPQKASLVDEVGREHKAPALKTKLNEIDDYLIGLSLPEKVDENLTDIKEALKDSVAHQSRIQKLLSEANQPLRLNTSDGNASKEHDNATKSFGTIQSLSGTLTCFLILLLSFLPQPVLEMHM